MSIYRSSVERPITTSVIFFGVIVLGLYSLVRIPIDLFPEMEPPMITVMTVYSGANARDIETNVTRPLEDALNSIQGLKDVRSVSSENLSVVSLEFSWETNLDEASNDIRDAIDMVQDQLPDGVERPMIFKFSMSMMPILFYSVTADESYAGLDKILEDELVTPINRIDGVGSVALIGAPKRRVFIETDPLKLTAYGLTLEQVAAAIQAENMNMPAGNIKMGMMDYQLRVEGEFAESAELNDVVIATREGKSVFLRDIAVVRDTLKDVSLVERINGRKGMRMFVMKQSGANTVGIANEVKAEVAKLERKLPPDVKIDEILDTSNFITSAVNNLSETLLYAILFVVIVVRFFLGRWRATLIVLLAIPISMIVSFVYLAITGGSLNIISLSAMAIAMGMVVDDAIVVLENIERHVEHGATPREASIYATNEVWLAVIVASLVIVAVFFPLTLVSGMTGVLFEQLGWIVSITIITSTLVAISLTPMMASRLLGGKRKRKSGRWSHENTIEPLLRRMDNFYGRTIRWALVHKKTVVIASSATFLASLLLLAFVSFDFMPESDQGQLSIKVELTNGLRVEESDKVAQRIEALMLQRYPELEVLAVSSGADDAGTMLSIFTATGSNIINVSGRLSDASERDRSVWTIMDDLRVQLSKMPEIVDYTVSSGGAGMMGASNTVDVQIFGHDFNTTSRLAEEVRQIVATVPGAENVQISRKDERPELQVVLDRKKLAENGMNTAMVSSALRNRVNGLTTSVLREEGEEYDIVVRFDERYRESISDLEALPLTNPMGRVIPLREVGEVREYWNPPNIERYQRQRVVTVSSMASGVSLGELASHITSVVDRLDLPEGVSINVGGAYEDMQESFSDLGLLLLLSLVLVFLVMASQFESLVLPFVIMFSIPFAFTGVFLALFLTGTSMSLVAGLGAVLLIGIVVKNGVVLVDFINLMRDRGVALIEAVALACMSRLRPVLMTTLTTILAMVPLAVSTGEGAESWRPMGIALVGGLTFSTAVTLVLIPVIYAIVSRRGERDKVSGVRQKFTFLNSAQESEQA